MLDVDQNYGTPETPKPFPTFKECVAQDVQNVIFNSNEFAEERYIDDMIDFSSTVVELSGDSDKQKEVQDIANREPRGRQRTRNQSKHICR